MRTAAPVVAVLAILAISGALVAAAIAGADQVVLAPFLFAAVAVPAVIGDARRVASPEGARCLDPARRRAVRRDRDVRRPGERAAARSRPDLDGGTLDPRARRRVARPVPLAARARVPLPRRPPAGTALAHPVAHHARRGDGGARAAPVRASHLSEPFDDVRSPMPVTFEGSFGLTVFWICWAGLLGGLFAGAAAVWWRKRAVDRRAPAADAVAELRRVPRPAVAVERMDHGACSAATPTTSASSGSCCCTSGSRWPWASRSRVTVCTAIERLINRTLVYGALTVVARRLLRRRRAAWRASCSAAAPRCARRWRRWSSRSRSARCADGCRRSWTGASRGRATRAPRRLRAFLDEVEGRARRAGGRRDRDRRGAARPDAPRCVYLLPAVGRLGRSPRAHARRGPRRRPRAHADRPRPPSGRRVAARPRAAREGRPPARRPRRRRRRGGDRLPARGGAPPARGGRVLARAHRAGGRGGASPPGARPARRRAAAPRHARHRAAPAAALAAAGGAHARAGARRGGGRGRRRDHGPAHASPRACARRGWTRACAPRSPTSRAARACPWRWTRWRTGRRRRSRRPRTTSRARRSPTP